MDSPGDLTVCVFSAHAEVVPNIQMAGASIGRILRARGGSSFLGSAQIVQDAYSPRTRR